MNHFRPEEYASEQGWDFSHIAHAAKHGIPEGDKRVIEHSCQDPASAIESLLAYCKALAGSAIVDKTFGLPTAFFNSESGGLMLEANWKAECEKCLELARHLKHNPTGTSSVKKVPYVVRGRQFGASYSVYLYQKKYRFMVSAGALLSGDTGNDRKALNGLMAAINRDNDVHCMGKEASHRAICDPALTAVPSARVSLLQLGHDTEGTMETLLMILRSLAILHRTA